MGMRSMRQGTSRMVPVVVSAGLAVGVFCGLLFGLGTGKRNASADPQRANNGVKRSDDTFTPESLANPNVKIGRDAPKTGSGAGSAVASGSGASGSADTGAGAEPAVKPTKLVVEIKPDAAAQSAKILVDGKEIAGATTEIDLDPGTTKKKVKVLVKATGYRDIEQEIELEGESTTLKLELTKGRSAPTSTATGGDSGATPSGSHAGGTGAASAGSTGEKPSGDKPSGDKPSGTHPGSTKPSTTKPKPGKGSGGLIDI
jgi:hypothetical protein